MEVRLRITQGRTNVKEILLGRETLIGRSADCNLKIASTEVSRKHCRIRVTDLSVSVADLGSANGTLLNGKVIPANREVAVAPWAELTIGPLKFVVEFAPPQGLKGPEDTVHSLPDTVTGLPAAKAATMPDETVDYLPSKQRVDMARQAARVGTSSDEMPQFVTPETPVPGPPTAETPAALSDEGPQPLVIRFAEAEVDCETDTAETPIEAPSAETPITPEPPRQPPSIKSPQATNFHKASAPPEDSETPRGLFGFLRRKPKKAAEQVRSKGQVALDHTERLSVDPYAPPGELAPVDDTVMLPVDDSGLATS